MLIPNSLWFFVFVKKPGKSYWRGRLSSFDLNVLTCFDQFFFILKILFTFIAKQVTLMKRWIVLILPPQLVFYLKKYIKWIKVFFIWTPRSSNLFRNKRMSTLNLKFLKRISFWGRICNTSFPFLLMNETNKLHCYITIDWIGMPGTNTLAYWAHLKDTKKMKCCDYGPRKWSYKGI